MSDETELPEGDMPQEPHDEWAARITRERMVVSPFQARGALKLAGLLDQVEQVMADPATDDMTRLAWQTASEFRRLSPTVDAIAQKMNLTDEQVDSLFVSAGTIEA